jgi:uncharacterized membrane protein
MYVVSQKYKSPHKKAFIFYMIVAYLLMRPAKYFTVRTS